MGRYYSHAQRAMARNCSALRQSYLNHARETMPADEVERQMRQIVRRKLEQDGDLAVIGLEDFESANLPMDKVTPIARRLFDEVKRQWDWEKAQ